MKKTSDKKESISLSEKEYLQVDEAALYLGVSKSLLYEWRGQGLEVIKIGGRTFYPKKLIDEFLYRYKI